MLLGADGFWLYDRFVRPNAAITYVGLDSLELIVPASTRAAQLVNGRWDSDLYEGLRSLHGEEATGSAPRRLAFVSLGSRPVFGKAVEVIRALKAQNICHVLIRETGIESPARVDFGKGHREPYLALPAIVLCGTAHGDAGFEGTLPIDRLIHVSADEQISRSAYQR